MSSHPLHRSVENFIAFGWFSAFFLLLIHWLSSRHTNRRKDGVVIAVMGVTGAGKSTFVKSVTGRDDIVVGHGLLSGMFLRSILDRTLILLQKRRALQLIASNMGASILPWWIRQDSTTAVVRILKSCKVFFHG